MPVRTKTGLSPRSVKGSPKGTRNTMEERICESEKELTE